MEICRDNNKLNHHHRQECRVKVAGILEALNEAISSNLLQLCKLLQLADKKLRLNYPQVEPLPISPNNCNNPNKLKLSIRNNTICIRSPKPRSKLWEHHPAKLQQLVIFKNKIRDKEHREEGLHLQTRHHKLKVNQTFKPLRLCRKV